MKQKETIVYAVISTIFPSIIHFVGISKCSSTDYFACSLSGINYYRECSHIHIQDDNFIMIHFLSIIKFATDKRKNTDPNYAVLLIVPV